MAEQQYRVIADRDKGDDMDAAWWDQKAGDRITEIVVEPGDTRVDHIERPVLTTDEPERTYLASDVQEAFERGCIRGEQDANERNWSRRQHEKMNAAQPPQPADRAYAEFERKEQELFRHQPVMSREDPSLPTREQAYEAVAAAMGYKSLTQWERTAIDALLALIQNGADRG